MKSTDLSIIGRPVFVSYNTGIGTPQTRCLDIHQKGLFSSKDDNLREFISVEMTTSFKHS